MDETIIHIAKDEPLTLVVDKLRQTESDSVILMVPEEAELLSNIDNLEILKEQTEELEVNLALVAKDETGRKLARQAGIYALEFLPGSEEQDVKNSEPVAPQEEEIEVSYKDVSPEESNKQKQGRPERASSGLQVGSWLSGLSLGNIFGNMPWKWITGIGVLVMGVAAVLLLVLPQAKAVVTVSTRPFSVDIPLEIAEETSGDDALSGRFVDALQERTKTFPATGVRNKGDEARGTVRILNHTGTIIGLRSNTTFSIGDLSFRMPAEVLVPPADGSTPGSKTAIVVAESGGTQGNISEGTELTVTNLNENLQELVYAQATEDFTGGTDREVSVVSEQDIEDAENSLTETLRSETTERLANQTRQGEEFYNQLVKSEVLEAVPSVQAGAERDEFSMKVQLRSWTLVPQENTLEDMLNQFAGNRHGEGYRVTPGTLQNMQISISESSFIDRQIIFNLSAEGGAYQELPRETLADQMRNLVPQTQATSRLSELSQVQSVEVEVTPEWYPRMPLLRSNINFELRFN